MKTLTCLVAVIACCASLARSAEPTVSLAVRKQVVDSDHDLGGRHGSRGLKVIQLKVEVTNTSAATITGAEVSGVALIKRSRSVGEKVSREALEAVKLPEMKPNARESIDLGRIELHEVESRLKKIEQSLEEWKVVCAKDGAELGSAVSGPGFAALDRKAAASAPAKGGRKRK